MDMWNLQDICKKLIKSYLFLDICSDHPDSNSPLSVAAAVPTHHTAYSQLSRGYA